MKPIYHEMLRMDLARIFRQAYLAGRLEAQNPSQARKLEGEALTLSDGILNQFRPPQIFVFELDDGRAGGAVIFPFVTRPPMCLFLSRTPVQAALEVTRWAEACRYEVIDDPKQEPVSGIEFFELRLEEEDDAWAVN